MREINLSNREILQGAMVGVMRQVESLQKNLPDNHGASPKFGWQMHVEGALGEMASAKAKGVFWSGVHKFRGQDILGYEVRTRAEHDAKLIVRPGDPNDAVFLLVTGFNGKYRLHGGILGEEAKQDEWLEGPGGRPPAYFVPQSALDEVLCERADLI